MKLSGHTILVTGGSAGIGLAFATKFLELGNEVIIAGRRQSRLDRVKQSHPRLHTIASDVSDATSVASLTADVKKRFPALDVLMNSAGVMVNRNLGAPATDLAELTSEIDINVAGTIRTTSALIDVIRANKGTIINVSSALAFVPLASAPIYCATPPSRRWSRGRSRSVPARPTSFTGCRGSRPDSSTACSTRPRRRSSQPPERARHEHPIPS
jgi:uncharacterized oxidoreductase